MRTRCGWRSAARSPSGCSTPTSPSGARRAPELRKTLAELTPAGAGPPPARLSRYSLERRLLVRLRRNIHHNALGRLVRRVRTVCDVLLR